jgi:hypothetical protein
VNVLSPGHIDILASLTVSSLVQTSFATTSRDVPPDLNGVDSSTGAGALEFLATLQPHGGRAKEPELLFSSPPIYPPLASRPRVEGPPDNRCGD